MISRISRAACLAAIACMLGPLPAPAAPGDISINVRGASLSDVLDLIAQQAKLKFIISSDAAQATSATKITLRLDHVSLRAALRAIESSNNLSDVTEDGILHIGPASTLARSFPYADGMRTTVINITYSTAADIYQAVQAAAPAGSTVIPDVRTNSLFVHGTNQDISNIRQIVASFDVPRSSNASFRKVEFPMSHLKASDAVSLMTTQLPPTTNDTYVANNANQTVIIQGNPDFIERASDLLASIDKPGQQVRFDVRVLDVTPVNDTSNIGVTYGGITVGGGQVAGSGTSATVFANNTIPVNATINLLQQHGFGKILAEPELTTLNNQKATLNIGQQYPITYFNPQVGQNQVQFINAGVNLGITPIIGSDGSITCQLDTEYSAILTFINGYPEIGDRHAVTSMRITSDKSIVIAGLFQDITNETVQKVPILGDIPLFGEIFKNRVKNHTRDEIVFVVTPHIINDEDFHSNEQDAISKAHILDAGTEIPRPSVVITPTPTPAADDVSEPMMTPTPIATPEVTAPEPSTTPEKTKE